MLKTQYPLRLNIWSVKVLFQDAPADRRHISLIYICFSADHTQFEKKPGLEIL